MEEVDRLLLFRDVVETGGFARAAERRRIAHSTVSRQIRALEASLGVPLMTRTTRSKQLTPAGEVVVRHAKRMGAQLDELRAELEQLERLVGGELRVQSLVHVGAALVLPAVDRFAKRHPEVEVQLVLDDAPLEFSKAGLDVALTVGLPTSDQLVARRLCDNEVCLVATPGLVAAHGVPRHPTDLLSWPAVAYRSGKVQIASWPYVDGDQVRTLDVRPRLTVNDGVSLLDAVRRGHGVGYLSRFSLVDDLREGRLVELLPKVALPAYEPVYVVRSDRRLVSARVLAFEGCLEEVVAAGAG